jgi:AcrR family transcriptional regulator
VLFFCCYGGVFLKNEKETKEKLLISAKKEFLEKGYMKSSLRSICNDAGVTTGALYFFFKDKEDIFASLVDRPLNMLFEMINNYYKIGLESKEVMIKALNGNYEEDIMVSRIVIAFLYQYYDEFILLIQKSQGSKYENCFDEFIAIAERHYRLLADEFSKSKGLDKINDHIIHWISHIQIESVVHTLLHYKLEAEAVENFETMTRYLIAGWMSLFFEKYNYVN